MSDPGQFYESRKETFAVFGRYVSKGKIDVYEKYGFDVVMGGREGVSFSDAFSDRKWFNCHCNGGVFNLGHRNLQVISALLEAMETLDLGNHHLVSGHRAKLAERLSATTDGRLQGVVFGAAGGEAIDLAIKVARAKTGRAGIVSAGGGYHGTTGLAMAAGDAQYRDIFGPNLPGFTQVTFDDLEAMEQAVDGQTAAVILEPVPATLGMPIARKGYFEGVQACCRRHGAMFILDEVQTGLGRTGRMWCYQHDGLEPDVVVTAKGLGGGVYPVSATLMTRELHSLFDEHPFVHISTTGGAEPGCAVALKVLDIVEASGFLDRVTELSDRFARGFEGLNFTLRRRGLMMGFKFEFPDAGMVAAKLMYDRGVFCVYANNDTSVLQFLPPLILTDDEADEIIERVRGALG
jgi:acetylornithine/succinyldiaminopimelate/putrescine aminotransferase